MTMSCMPVLSWFHKVHIKIRQYVCWYRAIPLLCRGRESGTECIHRAFYSPTSVPFLLLQTKELPHQNCLPQIFLQTYLKFLDFKFVSSDDLHVHHGQNLPDLSCQGHPCSS